MRFPTLLLAALLCASGLAQDPGISLEPFASVPNQPLDITHAGDGSGRLFVVQKLGQISILEADGTIRGTFLDIGGRVSTNGERGLLGLAFAPDYATSGRFYVNYTDTDGNTVLARYTVSAADADVADASSGETLLTIQQPFGNHNGGDLAFGPDGLLYVASGDGGSGNDPLARSQDLSSLLGKILRLDVSGATGYVAAGGYPGAASEVYAAGLRNPWRMSFDGDLLYLGDVGQGAREEFDRVDVTDGSFPNFGWVCFEGSRDNTDVQSAAQSNCQPYGAYDAPYYEYPHSVGRSVTGGVVYRGAAFPSLRGVYVAADYSSGVGFAIRGAGADQEVYAVDGFGNGLVGFGESETGELYAVSIFGDISRVTAAGALPAEIAGLSVERGSDCGTIVTWDVASEVGVDHYLIEGGTADAAGGLSWAAFAKTAAANAARYTADVSLPADVHYVRLRTVDVDGSEAVGEVLGLGTCAVDEIAVFPNPVRVGETVTLTSVEAGATASVFDASGREVRRVTSASGGALEVELEGLAAGTYLVRMGKRMQKLVVVK